MAVFKDTNGKQWQVVITVGSVKRVKEALGINLCGLVEDQCRPLGELLADLARLVDVLFVLCQAEAKAVGLSELAFAEALLGDALSDAVDAFVQALEDFFPRPETRKALRRLVEIGEKVGAELAKRAEKEFAEFDVDSAATRYIAFASNSRASSASSPRTEPSES
jgi:hypothetical protein